MTRPSNFKMMWNKFNSRSRSIWTKFSFKFQTSLSFWKSKGVEVKDRMSKDTLGFCRMFTCRIALPQKPSTLEVEDQENQLTMSLDQHKKKNRSNPSCAFSTAIITRRLSISGAYLTSFLICAFYLQPPHFSMVAWAHLLQKDRFRIIISVGKLI